MNLIFCKLKQAQEKWISFKKNSKIMNSDVCKITKGEKCGFNFVQAGKSSKDMNLFSC